MAIPGEERSDAEYRVIVGLYDQRFGATWPLIEMRATSDRLDFHARFGLSRFLGPWRLERAQIKTLYKTRFFVSSAIAVEGAHRLDWRIGAFHPESALLTLEEMGYPVDWIRRF
ncbi:hypothetical protein [Arthrobacter rhizosphaerae]|uniref:hypothetical protein n=1 Tax=Arthrobacter rhizosphaerae TaxID=2855490 RepID=UPI001FF5A045|nr:hypothetical protein [Arthrobacter rhizosphaerae]